MLIRRFGLLCLPYLLVCLAASCSAQSGSVVPSNVVASSIVTIARKPGRDAGTAQIRVNGKVQKITAGAVQAWTVREKQAALIVVLNRKKTSAADRYLLKYYSLDDSRGRVLGAVPFQEGQVTESTGKEDEWVFALAGSDPATRVPLLYVGSARSMPGIVPGGVAPVFRGEDLAFTAADGTQQLVKTSIFTGTSLGGIYASPQAGAPSPQYFQVFPNGTAAIIGAEGPPARGEWHTDGKMVSVTAKGAQVRASLATLETVPGVPAGTRFSARLLQPLSSRTAREGMTVQAVSITPIVVEGKLLAPQGSRVEGSVTQAAGVGWGFKHETASLTIDWKRLTLADGRSLDIHATTFAVENAQEKVLFNGKIKGIRASGTPGHSAENAVLTFAGIDPVAYIFATAAGSGVLGFAEPEILYNAGTELLLEYTRPLLTSQSYPSAVNAGAPTTEARQSLQTFVQTLPFRTRTQGSNKVSDLTNLVFIGDAAALQRAFAAAGWLPTDDLNSTSTFRTLKSLSGNQTYTQAPMSVLLLEERAPVFALSKTTNTFSSRHHIRVFPTLAKREGTTVLTASSTQDIGIAFSRKQRSFIHVIDQHLDNERAKVINDLTFTGCVDSVDLIPRPWLPADAYNATGDRLLTDRQAAVLRINDCQTPHATTPAIAAPPNRFERITRNTALVFRNSLYRGNLVYQGIAGGFAVHNYLAHSNELPEDLGAWRKATGSGLTYESLPVSKTVNSNPELRRRSGSPVETSPEDLAAMARSKAQHKWDPPRYEFSLQGGYLRFHSVDLSDVGILLTSPANPLVFEVDFYDQVGSGWTAGGTVTLNSWKHFSNEFSYFRQQGKYTLGLDVYVTDTSQPSGGNANDDSAFDSVRVGLTSRQFEYNLLAQLRPPTSRWRPYLAAGPAFQLIALSDAPLKKPAGAYTLGLKNIGLLKAAFDFGNTPPLDGGGIFQFGLQYGAGIKFRATPHLMLRADYRETWSRNPNIIRTSYDDFIYELPDATYETDLFITKPASKFLQDRFTVGIGFAF